MLESKNTQFGLSGEGKILWQEKVNNPVPGVEVAILSKGKKPLSPIISIIENETTSKYDNQELKNRLNLWFSDYLKETIEPLVMLENPSGVDVKDDAVSKISAKLYENMGIIPREDLEYLIAELTPENRSDLRAKKIRLGPVLVFMPDLNKPAAVRLRALLLSIYNGYDLPAKVPADGIVSVKVEDNDANPDYYRSIGYPLYGARAVRIDMLDRVISCVYDHADKGRFQARHEMAEWLGCSIEDLYKVLEAMGHTRIYNPLEQKDQLKTKVLEAKDFSEGSKEVFSGDKENMTSKKPDLAIFKLKKGKAFSSGKKGFGNKSAYKKDSNNNSNNKGKVKVVTKKPNKNKDRRNKNNMDSTKNRTPRVISAEAKISEDDSPFAILQQLKK